MTAHCSSRRDLLTGRCCGRWLQGLAANGQSRLIGMGHHKLPHAYTDRQDGRKSRRRLAGLQLVKSPVDSVARRAAHPRPACRFHQDLTHARRTFTASADGTGAGITRVFQRRSSCGGDPVRHNVPMYRSFAGLLPGFSRRILSNMRKRGISVFNAALCNSTLYM